MVPDQVIPDQRQLLFVNRLFLSRFISLYTSSTVALTNILTRLGTDHPGGLLYVILYITVDAVGISFVFPDIGHQPAAEKSAEEGIQHHDLHKIGMMPVGKRPGDADGALHAVGIIFDTVFFSAAGIAGWAPAFWPQALE